VGIDRTLNHEDVIWHDTYPEIDETGLRNQYLPVFPA
jgi:hypothetical protein